MQAIVIRDHGGPEVLRSEDVPVPVPGPAEVLVRHHAIGVNFVDTQHREGKPYPVKLPLIPGTEAAGVIAAVGSAVTGCRVGDRVGYAGPMGSVCAEYGVVAADRIVPVPDAVSFEQAAAVLLQGMTAHALTQSVYAVQPGDYVLIHAASGGVGLNLVQMAKQRGGIVIGTVSSAGKAEAVRAAGADHILEYADFAAETLRITGGAGVQVIYDGVGQATFDQSLPLLRAMGHMVVYGLASGNIPPFDVNRLSGITGSGEKGSLFLTWATLSDYNARPEDLQRRAADVLGWVANETLRVTIAAVLPLAEAAQAHRLLESRQTIGKIVLIP